MAAEARVMAESTRAPEAKARMLEIAASYDKLAARAAELARRRNGEGGEDPTK
jgi:hypothetical protein